MKILLQLLTAAVAVIVFTTICSASNSNDNNWSWNNHQEKPIPITNTHDKIQKRSDDQEIIEETVTTSESLAATDTDDSNIGNQTILEESQGRHLLYAEQEIFSNDTIIDDVIETILHGGSRDGRNLDGDYDQVYSDPSVQEALAKGDDIQARNLIKEKLCSLGLMSCDGVETEGKRPLYSNIYAQNRPQPGRRPGPPYGPPRPMPPPGKYYGPPRKIGYEGPSSGYGGVGKPFIGNRPPSYHGPYLEHPPSGQDNSLTYAKPPAGSIIYGSKPPGPVYTGGDAPYNFEHIVGEKIHVEDPHGSSYPGLGSGFSAGIDSFGPNGGGGSFGGSGSSFGVNSGSFGASNAVSSFGHHNSISAYPSAGSAHIGSAHLGSPALIAAGSVGHSALDPVPAASTAPLQQHVHHHFHHVEDSVAAKPNVVTVPVPVPVPVPSGNGLNSQFSAGKFESSSGFSPSSSGFSGINSAGGYDFNKQAQASAAFNAGFNGASQGGLLSGSSTASTGFGGVNSGHTRPVGSLFSPAIKPVSEAGLGNYGSSNYAQSTSGLYSSGGAAGSFHATNPNYYKKELQSSSPQYNNLNTYAQQNKYQSSNQQYSIQNQGGADDYQGFETSRQQNVDCTCVPIQQCPAADRIGRKDDLILPIDPRNLPTDIQAVNDANSTSTATVNDNSSKKVKREIKAESKQTTDDLDEDDQSDTQARLTVGSNFGNNFGNNNLPQTSYGFSKNKKILPTYGVSFGLPYPSGAYPFNSLNGGYPAVNPYFGSIGPNGLSLGILNVNPLVSFQVTKNEYGEKLIKPLVNLHVTPSENIIHKVGSLFKAKTQEILLNANHQHYHAHTHVPPPPEVFYPHGPPPPPHHHHHQHQHEHHGRPPPPFLSRPHFHNIGPNFHPEPFLPSSDYQNGFSGPSSSGGSFLPDGPPFEHRPHFPSLPLPPPPPPPPLSHSGAVQHLHFGQEFLPSNIPGLNFNQHLIPGQFYPPRPTSFLNNNPNFDIDPYQRSYNISNRIQFKDDQLNSGYAANFNYIPVNGQDRLGKQILFEKNSNQLQILPTQIPGQNQGGEHVVFPNDKRRKRRSLNNHNDNTTTDHLDAIQSSGNNNKILIHKSIQKRQSYFNGRPINNNNIGFKQCRSNEVCCRSPYRPQFPQQLPQQQQQLGRCGTRNAHGITGRIKNPVYIDGDSEYGEYPWQVAILKKDPKESVYVCGGTIIDQQHIITAAHCVKTYQGFDLRVRLGEWDVNHDVEFYPYIERDIISVTIHPEYYAGTLDNDLAILRLDHSIDFLKTPHISPACLPDKFSDFTGARCWTTGWGKDAFGDYGKYQNILKEVDVPIIEQQQCQQQLRNTRLGYNYKLNPGFICAGGEEGKDACKGDGGGPMVCERNGIWQLIGVVSWGIGCGQINVPGVYVRVSYYLDWIHQVTHY